MANGMTRAVKLFVKEFVEPLMSNDSKIQTINT